ncbi:phytanoyl-dioxygenase family protein [Fusarium austroafricanum]|uniref:Phytanoyl-dioxygenase family protein n=1 Tax=Fusarium austroafricanum TaxID=2364996 RepID=A0A8H4NSC1_9HYPO|nr:phytanoyl-dioxygenase family protein [Fusarium austroafricanum]
MVQSITRETGLQAFIDAVEKDGCVIVKTLLMSSLSSRLKEVQPYLVESAATAGSTVGALNGSTAICTRLVGRSKTVREKFFSDSLYQDIAQHFIGLETKVWYGSELTTQKSDPLLSISMTVSSQPGSNAQKLHRGDKNTMRVICLL